MTRGSFYPTYLKTWNKPDTERKRGTWSPLYVESQNVKYIEAESRMMVARGEEVKEMEKWSVGTNCS